MRRQEQKINLNVQEMKVLCEISWLNYEERVTGVKNCLPVFLAESTYFRILKGAWHEIFDLMFFSKMSFLRAPE
jgi:hypothetical protein